MNGNKTANANASVGEECFYDYFGRTIKICCDDGLIKEYTYDDGGRVKTLTVKYGDTTELSEQYEYDAGGCLTAVICDGIRSTYEYDAANQLVHEENGLTGIITEYDYTDSGAIERMNTSLDGKLISCIEYEYDLLGNQTKKDENGKITKYYYDRLSRLTYAVLPGNIMQYYEYDDYGNIKDLTETGKSTVAETLYYYDAANRLIFNECEKDGTQSRYKYDDDGNLVYRQDVSAENGVKTSSEYKEVGVVGSVYLYSCNSGNLTTYEYADEGGNFASVLSTRVKIGSVWGYDGNVSFGVSGYTWLNDLLGNWESRLAQSQDGFYAVLNNYRSQGYNVEQRDPKGQQQYVDGKLNNSFVAGTTIIAAT